MNSTIYGTVTSLVNVVDLVRIEHVAFTGDTLVIYLNDGRAIQLESARYAWLQWLFTANAEQRSRWEIVPSGGGVWWPDLDEGIELQPLLDMQRLH